MLLLNFHISLSTKNNYSPVHSDSDLKQLKPKLPEESSDFNDLSDTPDLKEHTDNQETFGFSSGNSSFIREKTTSSFFSVEDAVVERRVGHIGSSIVTDAAEESVSENVHAWNPN